MDNNPHDEAIELLSEYLLELFHEGNSFTEVEQRMTSLIDKSMKRAAAEVEEQLEGSNTKEDN